jgi:hypothetical protein
VTFNNAKAFLEGVFGIKSDFLRTPKFGISGTGGEWRDKRYLVSGIGTAGAEIALAAYGIASMLIALFTRNFLLLPYIGTTTIGLLYVGALSLYHSLGVREVE